MPVIPAELEPLNVTWESDNCTCGPTNDTKFPLPPGIGVEVSTILVNVCAGTFGANMSATAVAKIDAPRIVRSPVGAVFEVTLTNLGFEAGISTSAVPIPAA